MKWHKVPKFSVLGALALAPVLSMGQLTSLEDNQLHQVTGQSGIALTLDDVVITDIPDPNKPPTNGTSENFIELFSEGENGNGLSLALTNLSIGGYNPDGSRGGWTLGTVSDPLFIIVPSVTRLDRPGQDTNGDGTTTYPVLSLGTPSYATTQNQAAYIELALNFYQENIETFSYNAVGDLVANGDPSAVNIYDTLQHNLSRVALQNVILNGAQYGDGYDEYRITNVNLWAKNGDLNIVARINLEA
ncbi:MAG: hypothetical protein SVC26_04820, partial [Pseudomonadota bacterium]|nr:hypothetical protein [Pseudomonadota bacterium]